MNFVKRNKLMLTRVIFSLMWWGMFIATFKDMQLILHKELFVVYAIFWFIGYIAEMVNID